MSNAFTIPKAPSWLKQLAKNANASKGGQVRAKAMGGAAVPSMSNGRGAQTMKAPTQ